MANEVQEKKDRRQWTPPTLEQLTIAETATGLKAGGDNTTNSPS